VDYVEENNSIMSGYEFKWSPNKEGRLPKTFVEKYEANTKTIHRDNFREFVIA
jgi:hypothetical protein